MKFVVLVLLLMLALLTISLQKTYAAVPARELKRRARAGDQFAAMLFRAVGYGYSLQAILWILAGLSWAGLFVSIAQMWPAWLALILTACLVWIGFVYVPETRVTNLGRAVARWVTPAMAWLLHYVHPVVDAVVSFVQRHQPVHVHTGLYEREDLIALLEKQQVQPENRIEQMELKVALHALTFGDRLIRDVMVPRRVVTMISQDEAVGPVLMAELHKSGHSRFPVYADTPDTIVGILYLRDLTNKRAGGAVKAAMRADDVCYVHEEQPLTEVLQAAFTTHRQLMVVVNSFEEYVGIITLEDVLEQIIGHPIVDEFDQYEDLRAVAARDARKDHAKNHKLTEDGQPTTEVIE